MSLHLFDGNTPMANTNSQQWRMQMPKDDADFAIIFLYLGAKAMDNHELVQAEKTPK